jgi:NDP-sugar pyrophosphorylase family protein
MFKDDQRTTDPHSCAKTFVRTMEAAQKDPLPFIDHVSRAVILAAGRGTRMRELTASLPKPMVQVGGRPILEHIIRGLARAGINRVLIVVGYRQEVIRRHFRDGDALGLQIEYVEQSTQDGTGRVVVLAEPFAAGQPFLLSYGDILVSPSLYDRLVDLGTAEMLVSVRRAEDVTKGGAVFLNHAFEVTDLVEKPGPETAATPWYNAGVYTFRPGIFERVARLERSPRGEYELTDAIRAVAQGGGTVRAVEITGGWADVRDPEVLAELNRDGRDWLSGG